MTDVLGWRALFGVLGPSTNTVVQPEFDQMRPAGVTNHYSRIFTPNANAVSNDTFMNATLVIAENVLDAVDSVMTCSPTYLVMGMSAITFYGGINGAENFKKDVQERSGLSVSIGSDSTKNALNTFGGIKNVAFFSPYFPAANEQVSLYLEESGFSVKKDVCLQCNTWTDIAKVSKEIMFSSLKEIDNDNIDALIQVGTNLPMATFTEEFEATFDKPIISINTATYWDALRRNNITDKINGFGKLLSEY
tara:strand:- start:7085 stop:7831 length:747 start_codon:yes stop_codon:yes gene_type:complete